MTCTEAVEAVAPFTVRRGSRDAINVPAALRDALEQYRRACETSQRSNPSHQG